MDLGGIAGVIWAFVVVGVLMLALYAVIVLVARLLHRFMPATSPGRDSAMDTLRSRFAAGDIDEVEFERLRSALQRH
jgi:uncharacterized membrane protein